MEITTVVNEQKRGCGYRQPGGMYMVAPSAFEPCHRLPIELHVCPVCNGGIKPARGWTWVQPDKLLGGYCEKFSPVEGVTPHCERCVACNPSAERAGLIWIGEGFYKTPAAYMAEVKSLGLSRRVTNIPKGFKAGETVVYLVHPKAVKESVIGEDRDSVEIVYKPGIFTAFRPTAIEYILKGDETEAQLEKLQKRGLKLIRLVRTDGPQPELPLGADEDEVEEGSNYVS
jgi:hypothetical protein